MDIAVLLLLPLVAGYIFARSWIPSSVHLAREDGYRLYFRAAFYGASLFALSLDFHVLVQAYCEWYRSWLSEFRPLVASSFKEANSVDLTIVAAGAMLLAYPFAELLNGVFRGYARNAILRVEDDIERILRIAVINRRPVALTMANKKVYIGFVTHTDITKQRKTIGVLPLVSGYRSDPDGKLNLTTYYANIYGSDAYPATTAQQKLPPPLDHLSPEDFEIALPLELVQSIGQFDLIAYAEFQRQGRRASRKSGDSPKERKDTSE